MRPPWTCWATWRAGSPTCRPCWSLTYRDDELTREHPLQQLLGQASASGRVRRLPLGRLSPDAVRWLSAASRVDADEVFAMTSGNPFFVTEVLATGDGDRVPSTVVDAVLARVRRLDPASQDALVRDSTIDLVSRGDPDSIFLHFDQVDAAGHGNWLGHFAVLRGAPDGGPSHR